MKPQTAFIILSLAANVALGVVLLNQLPTPTRDIHNVSGSSSGPTSAASQPHAIALNAEAWHKLSAGDEKDFVARLRAEGFPPELVRALVAIRIKDRFADRIKALYATASFPYWRTEPYSFTQLTPEARAARRQIERESNELLKELLGPDAALTENNDRSLRRRYGDLAPEKTKQLQAIETDYSELGTQVREAAQGAMLEEDYAKLTYLEKEKRADLERLLSPAEIEQYDLRASPTAATLKSRLAGFEPSEAEYQQLFKIQQAFDNQYGITNLSNQQQERRRAAQAELSAKVQAVLSPERFADYQASIDPSYQNVNYLVRQFQLPPATTMQVVRLQQTTTAQAATIQNDTSLTDEQRNSALETLTRDASTKLSSALGSDGFKVYQQRGGQWLKKLQTAKKQ